MTVWALVQLEIDGLAPHAMAVSLIAARLLPIAVLSPIFGGVSAPMNVKLGLVLCVALFLHTSAGVGCPAPPLTLLELTRDSISEVVLGLAFGLIASLPFDSARIGGRFIDVFRGSSAEAALPLAGTKEAATGDVLYHLLLAMAATGLAMPMWLTALLRSFGVVPLGRFIHSEALALQLTSLVGTALATGLAIGAPIAALSLTVDLFIGLAARAAPSMNVQDLGAPVRILAGGMVTWLGIGLIAQRLLAHSEAMTDAMRLVMGLGHG